MTRRRGTLGCVGFFWSVQLGCGGAGTTTPAEEHMTDDAGTLRTDAATQTMADAATGDGDPAAPADASTPPPARTDAAVPPPAGPCEGADVVCDDFEGAEDGASVGAPWAYTGAPERHPMVDGDVAARGSHGIAFSSADTRGAFLYPAEGLPADYQRLYARAHVRFGRATAEMGGHVAFLVFATQPENGAELRLGASRNFRSQQMMLDMNLLGSGNELSQFSNGDVTGGPGSEAAGVSLSADRWYCVQVELDVTASSVRVWIDESEVDGLHITDWQGQRAAPWLEAFPYVKFGVHNYSGDIGPVWYDDLAVGTAPLGCP